jgi:hypothetical protein
LVHGAAAVSIGLALATAIKRQTRALAMCMGLAVVLVIGVPLYLVTANSVYGMDAGMGNVIVAVDSLLLALATRLSPGIGEIVAAVLRWDAVVAVVAAGLLLWTARVWHRRPIGPSREKTQALQSELDRPTENRGEPLEAGLSTPSGA